VVAGRYFWPNENEKCLLRCFQKSKRIVTVLESKPKQEKIPMKKE